MNIEATQDQHAAQTTGVRLRNARERLGLSQHAVAERLCLKVSTIRDIEEDRAPIDLVSTFLRGYIRSYARLVHIPEEELLPMMEKQVPLKSARVTPVQSFSQKKRRQKRDAWLMSVSWLVLFVVLGLTGAWWWQNHKAQQDEITGMQDSSSRLNGEAGDVQSVPDSASDADADSQTPLPGVPAQTSAPPPTVPEVAAPDAPAATVLPVELAQVSAPVADTNALVMNFTADCWLEVMDATGKTLFSGLRHKGESLNLTGQAPYKLRIGAPAAVQIQYQGRTVDLSRFIRTSQVARLTLNAAPSTTPSH